MLILSRRKYNYISRRILRNERKPYALIVAQE